MSLGTMMGAARRRRGLTQQQVADELGVKRPTVSQWENNLEKPGRERLLAFADLCGVTIEQLTKNGIDDVTIPPKATGATISEATAADVGELRFQEMPRNVPVLGTAAGGGEGDFILNGDIAEYVRRPPGVANAPQIFAVWVTGDSMHPRYTEGDLIYVHPGRRPKIGDYVLIEMVPTTDGSRPAFIKRLLRRSEEAIVVEQFNPAREVTFDARTVAHIYRILSTAELMGV